MGFRFRKSFKIAPGVKFNLNKKSHSFTFGGKGMHYTVNSDGKRTKSFWIPGSGLYYTETKNGKTKEKKGETIRKTTKQSEEDVSGLIVLLIMLPVRSLRALDACYTSFDILPCVQKIPRV